MQNFIYHIPFDHNHIVHPCLENLRIDRRIGCSDHIDLRIVRSDLRTAHRIAHQIAHQFDYYWGTVYSDIDYYWGTVYLDIDYYWGTVYSDIDYYWGTEQCTDSGIEYLGGAYYSAYYSDTGTDCLDICRIDCFRIDCFRIDCFRIDFEARIGRIGSDHSGCNCMASCCCCSCPSSLSWIWSR